MNDYLQKFDSRRTATWCRHSFANIIGNGGMRVLVEENPRASVAFDQRSSLAIVNANAKKISGEPMF